MLRTVETLILDEVHAVAGTKRGAHLALTVERLDRLIQSPVQRIGLSATQRPLEEIGRFVSGGRAIELVDAGRAKELDLEVVVPVDDMRELPSNITPRIRRPPTARRWTPARGSAPARSGPRSTRRSSSSSSSTRSTIVFVNNRRLAERLALRLNELAERELARAHHGSLAREQRVEVEELLKKGRSRASSPLHRSSWASTWAQSTSSSRWSRRSPSHAACSASAGRATSWARSRRAGSSRSSAPTCSSRRSSRAACATARSRRPSSRGTRSTCSRSRSWRSVPRRRWRWTTCTISSAAPIPSPTCLASSWRTCSTCSPAAIPPTSSPSCGPASHGTERAARSAAWQVPAGWR